MMRRKKPVQKKQEISDEKKKIKKIIHSLSTNDWNPEERETSILFDHSLKKVYLETSHGFTARRWFNNLYGDPDVKWGTRADTLKIEVPWDYCRQPDLIIKPAHRTFEEDDA